MGGREALGSPADATRCNHAFDEALVVVRAGLVVAGKAEIDGTFDERDIAMR